MSNTLYPAQVAKFSLNHKGGTKQYHIVLVEMANGQAAVFFRYGKTGAPGQATASVFSDVSEAHEAASAKMHSKERGGYALSDSSSKQADDFQEIKKLIGPMALPVLLRSCGEAFRHLDPSFKAAGPSAPPDPYSDVRAKEAAEKRKRDELAKAEMERMLAQQKADDEAKRAQAMRDKNPTWGMF